MIEVKNLTKSFGGAMAVDDVSFSVQEGKVTSIIGSSGSGKSTTLRCINGLEKKDSGKSTSMASLSQKITSELLGLRPLWFFKTSTCSII